ncbi:MAG: GFA family protein [Sulfurifustaceae bacterium]
MKGSCLCGTVRYEVDQLDGPIGHCSCRTCRKAHAAPFTTTARVQRKHLHWLAGEDHLVAFESSPGKKRYFCPKCGSHLIAAWDHEDEVILRVATLDESPHAEPVAHIWRSHEVDWLKFEGGIKSFPEWPPGRK